MKKIQSELAESLSIIPLYSAVNFSELLHTTLVKQTVAQVFHVPMFIRDDSSLPFSLTVSLAIRNLISCAYQLRSCANTAQLNR